MMKQDEQHAIWDGECRIFGRYLLGQVPTDFLRQKYIDFHQSRGDSDQLKSRLDGLLLRVARTGVWGTHLADAYATQFFGDATLRRKLVLVLALMECAPPACEVLDRTFSDNRLIIALRMGWYGVATGVMFVAAVAVLGPASAYFRLVDGNRAERTPWSCATSRPQRES